MLLLLFAACDVPTHSTVLFTVDDDVEVFTDGAQDGIQVVCSGDERRVHMQMYRTLFERDEGPTFHVDLWVEGADEGVSGELADRSTVAADVGYHGASWPTDVGTITVTDWVAVEQVVRIAVDVVGVGDGDDLSLDGSILCEQ